MAGKAKRTALHIAKMDAKRQRKQFLWSYRNVWHSLVPQQHDNIGIYGCIEA
jgi:hypothetical protein